MKKQHDYIAGSHHYWIHFWCGLVFGVFVGAWLGLSLFNTGWCVLLTAVIFAMIVAYTCGRWGDRAWEWIIQHLRWFT